VSSLVFMCLYGGFAYLCRPFVVTSRGDAARQGGPASAAIYRTELVLLGEREEASLAIILTIKFGSLKFTFTLSLSDAEISTSWRIAVNI